MQEKTVPNKVAILFADVCGSSLLYKKLGDIAAYNIVSKCIEIMTESLTSHEGVLVKTIGDEVMCYFPTALLALEAACAMQIAIEQKRPGGDYPIHIRIGFNYGEVIIVRNDLFGHAVNIAALVTSSTRARQILTTKAVSEALPASAMIKMNQISRAEFLGIDDIVDIFIVEWDFNNKSARIGLQMHRNKLSHNLKTLQNELFNNTTNIEFQSINN